MTRRVKMINKCLGYQRLIDAGVTEELVVRIDAHTRSGQLILRRTISIEKENARGLRTYYKLS